VPVDCGNIFEIVNLHPATKYSCQIRADSAAGKSDWSQELAFDTLGTVPGVPSSLSLFSTTRDSLTIMYEFPHEDNGSTVFGFDLECCEEHLLGTPEERWRRQVSLRRSFSS
jgi:hypothetical protein